ncbi:hypothetical protein, partial [Nocardia farcinica]|uniref:hypothetical protein n=1 Tax=Nocardia farcinica TaxID=37329 RepID=UPI002458C904
MGGAPRPREGGGGGGGGGGPHRGARPAPPGSRSWPQVLLAEFLCLWDPATVADRRKIAEELEELAGHDRM